MTDFDLMENQSKGSDDPVEFYLGTVTSWSKDTGVKIKIDGQDQPMQKGYKMLQVCRPLHVNARVVVMKQSGTYIVIGEVSNPTLYYHPSNLASSATLAQVIERCNLILDIMRNAGIIWNP